MEAKVYNQTGKEVSTVKLPENVFGLKWNENLVNQVTSGMMGNQRVPIAHAKNRGEVSGTGKKPWQQKGTGRARHGSRRPEMTDELTLWGNRPCERATLSQGVEYFISDTAKSPFPPKKDEELWVEVTVPPMGPPRPIQLAVSKDGVFTPLVLR